MVLVPDKGLDRVMTVAEVLVQEGLDVLAFGFAGSRGTQDSGGAAGGSDLATLISIYSFRATIGCYGVRSVEDARAAVEAGAAFAICSHPDPQALTALATAGLPFLLDALTPDEVAAAWQRGGACGVHVRPAEVFGRRYADALPEIVPQATLVPTVTDNDVAAEWLEQGAAAVSLSTSVLSRVFSSEDFGSLRQRAADASTMLARHRSA
ncbi:2-dehydro-3-deoxyphosphogluconate aldolase / (4S)-4-hydroxy-2-oxoglutarate aldolase [Propionibacterium cyclohexanicum]|uniref:2-dehydro-3-deoxyphosphogluconate aldolase / (4S)-4-hydroxy-2-oxoglutarate aldolase n=1 Tax=Propionibacterium cyclohexanicum TaxID=64702 RepID=A0A1H9U5Q9_9ACTN|nr:2-dehydro-3-deoxyphosphogluconate aldolase / (4S)-4-hydroxy-2-oxoglutarate aldolase [Propionibacterium cyclohexanicum]